MLENPIAKTIHILICLEVSKIEIHVNSMMNLKLTTADCMNISILFKN